MSIVAQSLSVAVQPYTFRDTDASDNPDDDTQEAPMQTQAFQLILYLPDDQAQPALALPKPDRPRVKDLSIREAAIQYLGE
jgi:hypothetical protein